MASVAAMTPGDPGQRWRSRRERPPTKAPTKDRATLTFPTSK